MNAGGCLRWPKSWSPWMHPQTLIFEPVDASTDTKKGLILTTVYWLFSVYEIWNNSSRRRSSSRNLDNKGTSRFMTTCQLVTLKNGWLKVKVILNLWPQRSKWRYILKLSSSLMSDETRQFLDSWKNHDLWSFQLSDLQGQGQERNHRSSSRSSRN